MKFCSASTALLCQLGQDSFQGFEGKKKLISTGTVIANIDIGKTICFKSILFPPFCISTLPYIMLFFTIYNSVSKKTLDTFLVSVLPCRGQKKSLGKDLFRFSVFFQTLAICPTVPSDFRLIVYTV